MPRSSRKVLAFASTKEVIRSTVACWQDLNRAARFGETPLRGSPSSACRSRSGSLDVGVVVVRDDQTGRVKS